MKTKEKPPWMHVREVIGHTPIVDGLIDGETPLYVERYIYQERQLSVDTFGCTVFGTQFGGSTARQGVQADARLDTIVPTSSLLVPPNVPTRWHYTGTVDFVLFYLFDTRSRMAQDLLGLAGLHHSPVDLADSLVSVATRHLVDELGKGSRADQGFMQRLAGVMLEQIYRVLTSSTAPSINPRHAQYPRLQMALNYIHEHLASDLSAEVLAKRTSMSKGYFRRLFLDATGISVHQYVLAARLEKARSLLSLSEIPISRIAEDCGFSSQSHFTARFRDAHAITPAQFRARVSRYRIGRNPRLAEPRNKTM